ncbi:MAG: polynucleotide adenylyltransferase PcnB, partial [Planctomycetota bacterium]
MHRGFEAYLVGGCVRDLLLGRTPKDYDIATQAHPQQVKRVFPRNCRIIGRRFKLAHLHFHGNTKILECSTFRRTPQLESSEDVLITRDNEFGTAEEDALRRDFTVNALFLDPTRDEILDYVNGLQDVRDKVIRTIGDPIVRFREDPVRILRAAKFAGRLGFTVEPDTLAAMSETSGDLVRSAPPRLIEEILRLLRGGHSLDSFQLLRDVGAHKSLVPVLADFLGTAPHEERVAFWRLLDALDRRVAEGAAFPNGVLLGALLVCAVQAKAERNPGRSVSSVAEDLLAPLCASLRLPKRDAGCLKRICGVQHRFLQADEQRRFRTEGFLHGPYFFEALALFELRTMANGGDLALVDRWYDLAREVFPDGARQDDGRDEAEGVRGGDDRGAEPALAAEETSDEPVASAADDTSNPWAGPEPEGPGEPVENFGDVAIPQIEGEPG